MKKIGVIVVAILLFISLGMEYKIITERKNEDSYVEVAVLKEDLQKNKLLKEENFESIKIKNSSDKNYIQMENLSSIISGKVLKENQAKGEIVLSSKLVDVNNIQNKRLVLLFDKQTIEVLKLKEGDLVDIVIVSNIASDEFDIIEGIEILSIVNKNDGNSYSPEFGSDKTVLLKVKGMDKDLIKLAKSKSYGKLEILKGM